MKYTNHNHNGAKAYECETATHRGRILKVDGGYMVMVSRLKETSFRKASGIVSTLAFAKSDLEEWLKSIAD